MIHPARRGIRRGPLSTRERASVNTSPTLEPRRAAAEAAATHADDDVLWHHAAFCRLALPVRAPRADWQRSAEDAAIRIERGPTGHALPAGMLLRLALLHICDAAIRTQSAQVAMGTSADALAAESGLEVEARGLAEQVERILAARIVVSVDGGPELGVLDARARPRGGGSAWRATIRLNGGFHASLAAHAVPLERRVIAALRDAPLAFDAYAWIRQALHGRAPDAAATARWDDLARRFGTMAQDPAAFRPDFEAALRSVAAADPSLAAAADDDGVRIRLAVRAADDAAAVRPPAGEDGAPAQAEAPAPTEGETGTTAEDVTAETISLPPHLTGLAQVIWLRRGYGDDSALVGVTPGARFDPDRLTVLAVEPIVMEVSGGLGRRDLSLVSAWIMANRDLIDDFWSGDLASYAEIGRRIRKVPAAGWR